MIDAYWLEVGEMVVARIAAETEKPGGILMVFFWWKKCY